MTPRLLVICLGGLAGAGAVVCCDMDAGTEAELPPEDEAVEEHDLPNLRQQMGEGDHSPSVAKSGWWRGRAAAPAH